MFKFKKSKFTKSENERQMFTNILSNAKKILDGEHPERIYDLINSLGKPYQFDLINRCIKGKPIDNHNASFIEHLFFKNSFEHYKLILTDNDGAMINYSSSKDKVVLPSKNLILTFPWDETRLLDAFNNIGEKVGNEWKQDPMNHRVVLINPLNIGYVTNGNHSTAMNIINNEAPMTITEEMDLSPVFDEIYTDGQFFRWMNGDAIIDEVNSIEFAAIFEIGRLIINNV